ncbi:FAD-binding dehydrogenase [Spirosoma telluris]|uniref:FAD-binding dehydrogenase n=1 Tax=Spirosoma telluris TaxID=2183553 RepID=UPI002FC3766A
MGTADFDRPEDHWPRKWAEAYVSFAAGEKRSWLHQQGLRFFPVVGWAERGGYGAIGHGNSVPRFHVTWGTGPGVLAPFEHRVREAVKRGLITLKFRHRVNELLLTNGRVDGIQGDILEPSSVKRGEKSSRMVVGEFTIHAQVIIITSGGIGANHDLVRENWPARLGTPPKHMLSGVPDHVDGRMLAISETAGANLINRDRMWHYTEGIQNWAPIWTRHGIRILPGPSSMWFDACGNRLPVPLFPGFDTLGTLKHIMQTGYEYTWFVLNQSIIRKEFALSGSEQNPDLTNKSWRQVLGRAVGKSAPAPVEAFKSQGVDFIVKNTLPELVAGMNALTGENRIDPASLERELVARDRQILNPFSKDSQITAIRGARHYLGDRLIRTAKPHQLLDPTNGPLIAVRLHILTRKTLGASRRICPAGYWALMANRFPAYTRLAKSPDLVVGDARLQGFGRYLSGGCIFSGRVSGRAAAEEVG